MSEAEGVLEEKTEKVVEFGEETEEVEQTIEEEVFDPSILGKL